MIFNFSFPIAPSVSVGYSSPLVCAVLSQRIHAQFCLAAMISLFTLNQGPEHRSTVSEVVSSRPDLVVSFANVFRF